jgi:hypothetical protein
VLGMGAAGAAFSELFGNGNAALQMQGWIFTGIAIAALAWALVPRPRD